MKVEIVGFFAAEDKRKSIGSLHVFVHGIPMPFDIRGILVRKRKNNKYFFQMPGKTVYEPKEGGEEGETEKIFFPFFSFFDGDLQKKMVSLIVKEGREFLEKELKEKK